MANLDLRIVLVDHIQKQRKNTKNMKQENQDRFINTK